MAGISIVELARLLGPVTERWPGCTVGPYGTTYQVRDAQGVTIAYGSSVGEALQAAAALTKGGK